MKKLMMSLILIGLMVLFCCAGAAEKETNFYVVTYDEISVVQSKEPGVDLKLSTTRPVRQFYTFAGWSETPDATVPDYLPGDTYTEDRNLNLYAVLLDPLPLGEISSGVTLNLPTRTQIDDDAYYAFTVTKSGNYSFSTVGTYRFSNPSPRISTRSSSGYSSSTIYGTSLYDDRYNCIGFNIAAELKAGTTYYLSFGDQGFDVSMLVWNDSYTVTYDEISVVQSKEPGVDLKLSTTRPVRQFYTFAGWSETPGATVPDYLPGDTYTEDRNLNLYAVLLEPLPLGEISSGVTLNLSTRTQIDDDAYYSFTVTESGFYSFSTIGTYRFSNPSPRISTRSSSGYSSSTIYGTSLYDDRYNCIGFNIAAELKAGTTYYLSFGDQGFDVNMLVRNDAYTVTYDEISVVQAKEPGVDLKLSTTRPVRQFYTFAGWSETPGATVSDYLPGDTYTEDRNLNLYAVLLEPLPLGAISGSVTLNLPTRTQIDDDAYYSFTVTESGFYSFSTVGTYRFLNPSPRISTRSSSGYSSSTIYGTSLYDNRYNCIGFNIAAELKAGTTYYLSFGDQGFDVPLLVEPQYSDPNPFGASSVIPRGITTLEADAFANTALDSFFCPESITHIDRNTFADCPNLRKIVISGMNVTIDPAAFAGCTDLLIVAPINSTAHKFALEYGFEFRALPKE